MNYLKRTFSQYPVAPWVGLYLVGLVFNAVGNFVFEPAGYVAYALMLLAPAVVALIGLVTLVRGSQAQRALQWCALLGGAAVTAIQIWSIFSRAAAADNSIGGLPLVFFAGLVLLIASAGLSRPTDRASKI